MLCLTIVQLKVPQTPTRSVAGNVCGTRTQSSVVVPWRTVAAVDTVKSFVLKFLTFTAFTLCVCAHTEIIISLPRIVESLM